MKFKTGDKVRFRRDVPELFADACIIEELINFDEVYEVQYLRDPLFAVSPPYLQDLYLRVDGWSVGEDMIVGVEDE